MALPIPDISVLARVKAASILSFSQRGHVAPNIYLVQNGAAISPRLNYYKTFQKALDKALWLKNEPAGKNWSADGSFEFNRDDLSAKTLGYNCDFYMFISAQQNIPVPFDVVLYMTKNNIPFWSVVSFYKNDNSGPYFCVFDTRFLGSAAVRVNASGKKLEAMDVFYREAQLLKNSYNTALAFVTYLASKKKNAEEQRMFDMAMVKIGNYRAQIQSFEGIKIIFQSEGKIEGIGLFGIDDIIIAIIVVAAIAAWTVDKLNQRATELSKIREGNDMFKWSQNELSKAQTDLNTGVITKSQYDDRMKALQNIAVAAGKLINDNSKTSSSMFGDITNVIKWGVIGLVAWKGIELLGKSKSK